MMILQKVNMWTQLQGLNLHANGFNDILADEMAR
jgi:hypothetical protein